jgi:IS1 family transposase
MNSWLFPPQTREVQFDEKWAFVGKKAKHCDPDDPDDARQGDHWDHVALDPEHRLVVSVVPGKRTAENVRRLVNDFKQRTQGRLMNLITTDEYSAYETEILAAYGETVVPPRTGKPGRPRKPYQKPPDDLRYATVHKTREKGRVTKIEQRVVFGTVAGRAGGAGGIDGQQGHQHGLRRTPEWDRPQPQRPEGAEDLLLLQGLGGA